MLFLSFKNLAKGVKNSLFNGKIVFTGFQMKIKLCRFQSYEAVNVFSKQ